MRTFMRYVIILARSFSIFPDRLLKPDGKYLKQRQKVTTIPDEYADKLFKIMFQNLL